MNTMKRNAALLMALCLVFQLVPAPAGAAETAAITVSSAEAYPGNSCYIDVWMLRDFPIWRRWIWRFIMTAKF